ncbi:hypothetical protein K1Y78_29445 [Streptomyces sp. tea 10]|nr:hypothetical protein [Streptomyces sp. tea 10]
MLWFLFLFNGAVAAFCAVPADGVQGVMAAVGMGLVSLGAGFGLLPAGAARHSPSPPETSAGGCGIRARRAPPAHAA